ncbi:hypothetical protein LBMAG46_16340 [Planctomycetia bacterium]|nr:hypothetical protein LBMAG46_16340 [Planctomycetia bacterium]
MAVQNRLTVALTRSAVDAGSFKPHFWFDVDDDRLDVSLADARRLAEHVNKYLTIFANAANPEPIGFCIRQTSEFWAVLCQLGTVSENQSEISIFELLKHAAARTSVPVKAAEMLRLLLQKVQAEYGGSRVKPCDLFAGRLKTAALTKPPAGSVLEPVQA